MRATERSRHHNGLQTERTMKTQRENNKICIKMEAQKPPQRNSILCFAFHFFFPFPFLFLTGSGVADGVFVSCWYKKQHANGLTQMRLQYFHVSFFSMEFGVRVTSTFAREHEMFTSFRMLTTFAALFFWRKVANIFLLYIYIYR